MCAKKKVPLIAGGDIDMLTSLASGEYSDTALELAGRIAALRRERSYLAAENEYLRNRVEEERVRVDG